MPTITKWCPPEVFLEHNGVKVFHTYEDNDVDNGTLQYHFTSEGRSDDPEHQFDIRDFDTEIKLNPGVPFDSMENPEYRKATSKQRKHWQGDWARWRFVGFDEAKRAILIEAIDKGLIKNPD